jgi:hypothetical protein
MSLQLGQTRSRLAPFEVISFLVPKARQLPAGDASPRDIVSLEVQALKGDSDTLLSPLQGSELANNTTGDLRPRQKAIAPIGAKCETSKIALAARDKERSH